MSKLKMNALTKEEAEDLFDATARQYLGISGRQFLMLWDQGEYKHSRCPKVERVAIILPMVRPIKCD